MVTLFSSFVYFCFEAVDDCVTNVASCGTYPPTLYSHTKLKTAMNRDFSVAGFLVEGHNVPDDEEGYCTNHH